MTPVAYRAAIHRLGFKSINEAGRWFGLSDRTARWIANPDSDGPPGSVEKLILYMLATDQGPGAIDDAIRKLTRSS